MRREIQKHILAYILVGFALALKGVAYIHSYTHDNTKEPCKICLFASLNHLTPVDNPPNIITEFATKANPFYTSSKPYEPKFDVIKVYPTQLFSNPPPFSFS